jgi:signal transduction histidine kinase
MKPIRCFEGEIRQVISNLIGNALDALASGGHLFLRSREGTRYSTGDRGMVITIADTGTGMNPATVQKAFRAFYTTKGIPEQASGYGSARRLSTATTARSACAA